MKINFLQIPWHCDKVIIFSHKHGLRVYIEFVVNKLYIKLLRRFQIKCILYRERKKSNASWKFLVILLFLVMISSFAFSAACRLQQLRLVVFTGLEKTATSMKLFSIVAATAMVLNCTNHRYISGTSSFWLLMIKIYWGINYKIKCKYSNIKFYKKND